MPVKRCQEALLKNLRPDRQQLCGDDDDGRDGENEQAGPAPGRRLRGRTGMIREERCAHADVAGGAARNSRTWRSQVARSAALRTWAAPGSSISWAPGIPVARRYELSGSTSRSPVGATTRVGADTFARSIRTSTRDTRSKWSNVPGGIAA